MALSVDQFGKALVTAGLFSADELKALWNALPADSKPKQGDGFAKLLVQQGKLNQFQADELLSGRNTPLVMGDYLLVAELGAGGMGKVYKARHRRMERIVALKVMSTAAMQDEAAVKRFQREVKAAARLEHPNIVTAYDSGEIGKVKYLVMQFVDGGDLSQLVKQSGPLEIERAVDYVLQAARGLGFAHGEGVVHRDIKPANLLLDKKGVVKILDMGLARIEGGDGLTATEQVMGTVDYMSPEQAANTKTADGRSDIYSLGCTLWFLLTAKKVYDGDTMISRLMSHRNDPPPSLVKARDDVPWSLEQAFHKMIAKSPEERFQSMDEVVAALEPFAPSGGSRSGVGSSVGMGPQSAEMASFLKSIGPAVKPQKPAPTGTKVDVEATAQFAAGADTDPKSQLLPPSKKAAQPQAKGSGKKPPPNKNLLLAVAGGGALLVLLGVWFIFRDKDGNEIARVQMPEGGSVGVQQTNPIGTARPQATSPAAKPSSTFSFFVPGATPTGTVALIVGPTAAGPTPGVPRTPIDLLTQFDPARDNPDGGWKRQGTSWTSAGQATLKWARPQSLPEEYDLDVEFEVTDRHSKGVALAFLTDRSQPALLIDHDSKWVIASVDGFDHADADNPTRIDAGALPLNQRVSLKLSLRRDGLRVIYEGKPIIDWHGTPDKFGTVRYYTNQAPNSFFFSSIRPLTVHRFTLTPIVPAPQAGVVYLDDLPETKYSSFMSILGKHGGDSSGKPLQWHGRQPAHSLFMHAYGDGRAASIDYSVAGKFETLTVTVGLNNNQFASSPLTFRVLGDGRELWKSPPIKSGTPEAACSVSVAGVHELRLEAACDGSNFKAGPVWIEPRLTPVAAAASGLWSLVETKPLDGELPNQFTGAAVLSHDGLTLVATIGSPDRDVAITTRNTPADPWPPLQILGPQVNSQGGLQDAEDAYPAISQDRRTLVFFSKRQSANVLWTAVRNQPTEPFGTATKLGLVVNERGVRSIYPALSANGQWLTFVRSSGNNAKAWVARRNSFHEEFTQAQPLGPAIDALGTPGFCAITDDGRTIVAAVFEGRAGTSPSKLWTASRQQTDEPFTNPVALGAPFQSSDSFSVALSGDGQTLWSVRGKVMLRAVRTAPQGTPEAGSAPSPAPAAPRWPLAPSKPEDIKRLLDAKVELTVRAPSSIGGASFDSKLKPGDALPTGPVTIVGALVMRSEPVLMDDALVGVVAGLTDLEDLNFYYDGTYPVTPAGLSKLASLVNLRRLDLLYLHGNTKGLSDLLKSWPHLEYLRLPGRSATDEWAAAAAARPSIVELSAYRSGLSDAGLAHLEKMPQLKQLQLLDCEQPSQAAIDRFAAAVPGCRIQLKPKEFIEPRTTVGIAAPPPAVPAASSGKLFMHDPAFPQWMAQVQAMPAEQQIDAVSKKLMELNPGFDGKVTDSWGRDTPKIEAGMVTEYGFYTAKVTDISPVRALSGLKSLRCTGLSQGGEGDRKLTNLSPLSGMHLTFLDCTYNYQLFDLSPLTEMPLVKLHCFSTSVSELSPLQSCESLQILRAGRTKVTAASVAALQKALPNCGIEWDDPAKATTQPAASGTK